MRTALLYLLVITIAEVTTAIFNTVLGVLIHVGLLVTLIFHAATVKNQPYQQLLFALTLVPLVRILSLSMPLASIPQIWWYPIIYAPLFLAAVTAMRVLGYRREQVGLVVKRPWIQVAVVFSGFVFGVIEYYILKERPLIAEMTWSAVWWRALIFLVSTGFVEEFMFRGVLQQSATKVFGTWPGILYASIIFAVLHVGFLSWLDLLFVFSVAMFFSWIVKKTGSLLGVTVSHGITNVMIYLVAPFIFM